MITVHKQEIANWLLIDCQATLHTVREKLHFFEQKYHQSWNTFKQQIKNSADENFSQWDDYIEWKDYIKMVEDVTIKIQEIKHGHFAIT